MAIQTDRITGEHSGTPPVFHLRESPFSYGIFYLLIGLLAFYTFGSLSGHLFDNDDWEYLDAASAVQKGRAQLFSPHQTYPGRPVHELVFLACYFLWEDHAAYYHLLLAGLHLGICFLLPCTLRKLGMNFELSLLATLFFLMNVAHFRAIHWISSLGYLTGMIFSLGCLICFLRFLSSDRRTWLSFSVLLLLSAIFSHPSSVSTAFFCTYIAWRKKGASSPALISSYVLTGIGISAVALLYLLYPAAPQVETQLSSIPNPIHILKNLLWYFARLVLSAHWLLTDMDDTLQNWELIIGFIVCLGLILLYWKMSPPVNDWIVWSSLTILPFLNNTQWLPAGPSRFLYFSSLGSSVVLASLLYTVIMSLNHNLKLRRTLLALGVICIVASSVLSLKKVEAISYYLSGRSYAFRGLAETSASLFQKALNRDAGIVPADIYPRLVQVSLSFGEPPGQIIETAHSQNPGSSWLNMMLGVIYSLEKNPATQQRGEKLMNDALSISKDPMLLKGNAATACRNYASHLANSGRHQEAVDIYLTSLNLFPGYTKALDELLDLLTKQDNVENTKRVYQELTRIIPSNLSVHTRLGALLHTQGEYETATRALRNAVEIDPTNAELWNRLSQNQNLSGDTEGAIDSIQKAIALSPSNHAYIVELLNYGTILHTKNQLQSALSVYRQVIELSPNLANAHVNAGILYYSQKDYARAASSFQKATERSPDDPEAFLGLAQAYEKMGEFEKAILAYRETLSIDPDNAIAKTKLQTIAR